MRAYLLIQSEGHGGPIARRLLAVPGIVAAEDVSGPYDAIALAKARSTRQLFDQVIERILSLPGVTRALPAPLINSLAERPETDSESSVVHTGSGDQAA